MLNDISFVADSIKTNLFFLRTLREYCLSIQLSFYVNNKNYSDQAESLRKKCENLETEILNITNSTLPKEALEYQLLVTDYTLPTELLTEKLFDVTIATDITRRELELKAGEAKEIKPEDIEKITSLNERAKSIVKEFSTFTVEIRDRLRENELFSYLYISLYDYMIIVADIYQKDLERLDNYAQADPSYTISNRYQFSISMYEILLFIRGLINPYARNYIKQLNTLIEKYAPLLDDYQNLPLTPTNQKILTEKNLVLVDEMRSLFISMLNDLLEANLYFIIEPTAIDNFYTDINFFYYTLLVEKEYLNRINNGI